MDLNARQIGEIESRAFLSEEIWKAWKIDYDNCMAYRKTLKGKPTDEQRIQLEINAGSIEFYGSVLFHSVQLAKRNLCSCTKCGQRRTKNL
jgi:hypothetical protein